MKVAVIGAGSWGTALANVLASNDNEVCMWARKPEVAEAITNEHRNPRYLSNAALDPAITATAKLEEALAGAGAVVVVTPSRLLRDFAERMKEVVSAETPIIICSKGVEQETMLLPIEIYADVLGNEDRLAVLSGPNHAEEVVYRTPSGTVIASPSEQTALFFRGLFASTSFRCYVSSDYIGVELCAAFKNVIAIAVGIAYGMGMGDNTAAMLMTRGMAEMSRLVYARGGDPLTVMGLAGAGDLIATCTSQHSRNRTFGDYGKGTLYANNLLFCALAGALWYSQFFGFGIGQTFFEPGSVVAAFAWCILMALNVTFSNVWGIILREWRGASRKTVGVLVCGLAILIFSLVFPNLF